MPNWKKLNFYKIGQLTKPHGVKGEIAFVFDDDVFDRENTEFLAIKVSGLLVPFFIEEYRFKNNSTALLKFIDIDTPEQASNLAGSDVYYPMQKDMIGQKPIPAQLIGYNITDNSLKKNIGTILRIDNTTANTLFEIEDTKGRKILVPAANDLIQNINTDKKEISMNIPDGLLQIE